MKPVIRELSLEEIEAVAGGGSGSAWPQPYPWFIETILEPIRETLEPIELPENPKPLFLEI